MIAATDKTIHGTNGTGWQEELTFAAPEALRGIAIDDKQMVAVGTLESVMVKRFGETSWERLPPTLGSGVELEDVATIAGERFVAVGEAATIAVRTGVRWCDLEAGVAGHYEQVEAAPGGRVASAIANDAGKRHVVRVEAPPPTVPRAAVARAPRARRRAPRCRRAACVTRVSVATRGT